MPKLIGHTPLEGGKMLGCELKKSKCLSLGTNEKGQKVKTEVGPRDRGVRSNLAPPDHLGEDPKPTSMNLCTPFYFQNRDSGSLWKKREKEKEEETNTKKKKKKASKRKKKKKKASKRKKKEEKKEVGQKSASEIQAMLSPHTLERNQGCKPEQSTTPPPQN